MNIEVIEDVSSLRDAWVTLLDGSETGTVFQWPVFLETWWDEFKTDEAQRLLLGTYDGDELVGFGAFEAEKNVVRFLGMRKVLDDQELTDYGDIVARSGREEEVWREFISYIKNHISDSEFTFDYIKEDSPSFEILPKLAGELGLAIHQEKQDVAPFLTLSRSWDEYVASLPRKKRHELRRKMRRFEEGQRAELRILEEVTDVDMDMFVELVRASSDEKRKFMKGEMALFFKTLIHKSVVGKLGLLSFLEVDGKMLGTVFLFKDRNMLLGYNGGAPALAGQAVGVVMTAKLIEWAMSQGFTEFDFLRGGERYKYDLGARDRQLWQLRLSAH